MKNKLFWLGLLSLIASVCVHIYLANHHYNFKYAQDVGSNLCNMSDFMNCNTTTASSYSEFFGIPMAILGAVLNFLLLFGLAAFRWHLVAEKTRINLPTTLKLTSFFIFLTSLFMGIISLTVLKSLCPFCLASYILSFVTFISVWGSLPKENKLTLGVFEFKVLPGILLTTLIVGFLFHTVTLSKFAGKDFQEFTKLQFESWKSQPVKEINTIEPLVMNASEQPKMNIVEFADFLCIHCKNAFPKIHTFVKSHPDVQFSFQAFPLDGACNPEIGYSEGTRCLLARLSHCAGKQNKGWEAQDWIFENQASLTNSEKVKEETQTLVNLLNINNDDLQACLDSEEAHKAIKEQAKLGKEIGVKGTPAIYVNGKKTHGVSLPVLELIYKEVTK